MRSGSRKEDSSPSGVLVPSGTAVTTCIRHTPMIDRPFAVSAHSTRLALRGVEAGADALLAAVASAVCSLLVLMFAPLCQWGSALPQCGSVAGKPLIEARLLNVF